MKRILLVLIAAGLAAPLRAQDPDSKKTAKALYLEGLRLETEKKDFAKAIEKYRKALEKAAAEKLPEVAAPSLFYMARCYETMEPENVGEAQTAYGKIVSDYGDQEPYKAQADEKLKQKGVDVYLRQYKKKIDAWRLGPDSNKASVLDGDRQATWGKIEPLNKDAIYGLIAALGHEDEVVRGFAAERLAEVIDGDGVAMLITRLNDPSSLVRSGASMAVAKIFAKWNDAKSLDDQADAIERDLNMPLKGESKIRDDLLDKSRKRAATLREDANKLRRNIPAKLNTPEIQTALQKVIEDESALSTARLQAATAAGSIGHISGGLTDALIKGMGSKDRNVRIGCCRAAAEVNTAEAADKHKLADTLMKIVMYEPERDDKPRGERDWANEAIVRQAAAEALGKVGLVKSIEALIEALDDNSGVVREAANYALIEITRKDFGFESEPHIDDPNYKDPATRMSETKKREKQITIRREAIAKWEAWWRDTKGVEVLVERFYRFQAQWKEYSVPELFDSEFFLKKIESRAWTSWNPAGDKERAERVLADFKRKKDVFVKDATDLPSDALEKFYRFIGGEIAADAPASPGVRWFVAEVVARMGGDSSKLGEILSSDPSAAKKTGGAMALGLLDKSKVGASERQALETKGLTSGDPDVREASAYSLGKVGSESSAGPLATVAGGDTDNRVRIAALRALAMLGKNVKDEGVVKTVGELIGHEPGPNEGPKKKSDDQTVREYAAEALGAMAHPAALRDLIRGCRDSMRNVREAANRAIKKVYDDNKDVARQAFDILKSDKEISDDRVGAALALGQMGDQTFGRALIYRCLDENPPRVLKDADPAVRAAVCRALGQLKVNTKTAVEGLLRIMAEDVEEVRQEAYNALRATVGEEEARKNMLNFLEPGGKENAEHEFKAWYTEERRKEFLAKWRGWFEEKKGSMKDDM